MPSEEEQLAMYTRLSSDPRDQAQPMAMAVLLKKIWQGDLLNETHRHYMDEIMTRCQTGANRLSGKLPHARSAHRSQDRNHRRNRQ